MRAGALLTRYTRQAVYMHSAFPAGQSSIDHILLQCPECKSVNFPGTEGSLIINRNGQMTSQSVRPPAHTRKHSIHIMHTHTHTLTHSLTLIRTHTLPHTATDMVASIAVFATAVAAWPGSWPRGVSWGFLPVPV